MLRKTIKSIALALLLGFSTASFAIVGGVIVPGVTAEGSNPMHIGTSAAGYIFAMPSGEIWLCRTAGGQFVNCTSNNDVEYICEFREVPEYFRACNPVKGND